MGHWALGLVWLLCGFPTACEGAAVDLMSNSNKETFEDKKNDIRKGAELSYCGGKAFNPEIDTCCEAVVTPGLSEKVSACCGQKAYDKLNEICCQSTVIPKPGPKANCCSKDTFDEDTQLCCGKNNTVILKKNSSDHQCCGDEQFNSITECCCPVDGVLKTQPKPSCCGKESDPHGTKPYSTPSQQIDGSQSTAVAHPATDASWCGKEAFDKDTQLCCGKHNTVILKKNSSDHQCCGDEQFNSITECCCPVDGVLKTQPKPSCCGKESGVPQQSPTPPPICTEPTSSLCGSIRYNPKDQRCCERSQKNSPWCCAPGRCNDAPSVYNPNTHICCDGCVSEWIPWMDQVSEDREECSALGIPFNPPKGTHGSHSHGSPGIHCCGTEEYSPHNEICLDVHRHQKTERTYCCGREAYDITDPLMKCCAGTLHHMTVEHEGECCGSVLQKPQEVCCSSEDKEVLYKVKEAFQCCGHHYYNTSLWSCCAGKLSTVRHPCKGIKGSRLVNDTHLCNKRFGVTAPSTVPGKVLLVFYGLLGCSATILFFNLFLERVITLLSFLIFWCHRGRTGLGGLEGQTSEDNRNEEWKPSVYQVTLILFFAVLLVACGAAFLYSPMEGWTYMESLYFCFVAFSTVGFGDYISGQREHHEDTWAYQVANCLLMLLGVCCTYSLFNTISVIIKEGLNWMLTTLAWMYSSIRHYKLQFRPLFKLCFSDSEPPICYEDDTLHRQQLQAASSLGHGMLWHTCAPNAKCICDEAQVETVCRREIDTGISAKQEQDNCLDERDIIYARPLPT